MQREVTCLRDEKRKRAVAVSKCDGLQHVRDVLCGQIDGHNSNQRALEGDWAGNRRAERLTPCVHVMS